MDTCLITVSDVVFYAKVRKKKAFVCDFCPVVLDERRGCTKNPVDMKTVWYCFVTCSLYLPV